MTASQTQVTEGRTIACAKSVPFGTRMEIEGLGVRVCEDTGSAIKHRKIDVYIADLDKALEFGKQTRKARIIKNGGDSE